jgi:predicted amidohydrolase YtcJ
LRAYLGEESVFPKADLLITNAHVFTSDPSNPAAEAVAVRENRIVYAGDMKGVEDWHGPSTRVLDGLGNTLMPGFIDSHFHLLWGCIWLGSAQLQAVVDRDNLNKALRKFAAENKTSEWVVGRGIKYGIISTRQELDAIISNRPIYVGAFDGHTAWANTKALEMAGILREGRELGPNGIVVRDDMGIATGELREDDAMSAVHDLVPVPEEARKRELLNLGMKQITATVTWRRLECTLRLRTLARCCCGSMSLSG